MSGLNPEGEIEWISKAKGFAILAVVACHTVQQFAIQNGITRMADAGRYGVQLFFVISAILAYKSFESNKITGWKSYLRYLCKRLVRLIPVLYLAIIWNIINYCISAGQIPGIENEIWKKALYPALFINGFSYKYFNSWMTWYIGVYVMFVAIVPLLHRFINSAKKAIIFFTVTAILGWLINYILVMFCGVLIDDWFFYGWLPRQLPVFALGIVLYYFMIAESIHKIGKSISVFAFVVSAGFLISMVAFTSPIELHVRYGILLTCFCLILFKQPWMFFNFLKPFGKNSLGIYLFHGCLITIFNAIGNSLQINRSSLLVFFLYYICLVLVSFLVSKLVNRLVEKPFFKLTKHWGL